MSDTSAGFSIAAFAFDGELVGQDFWPDSEFDEQTLDEVGAFLSRHGPVFEAHGTGDRSAVRTKFTSASGTALATVFCRAELVCSLLIMSGQCPAADQTLAGMFIDSVARSSLALQAAESSTPFAAIRTLDQRPLVVVVTWPVNAVTDGEHRLIRTHSLHLAAAFLRRTLSDEP